MKFWKQSLLFGSHFLGYMDEAGGDDGGSGGGTGSNVGTPPDDNKGDSVTLTKDELNALVSGAVSTALKEYGAQGGGAGGNAGDDDNAFNRQQQKRQQQQQHQQNNDDIRAALKFDMEFDSFIKDNQAFIGITAKEIRDEFKEYEGEELNNMMRVNAARHFFASKQNLDLLPERDQQAIKTGLQAVKRDDKVDSKMVWGLMENALYIAKRLETSEHHRNNGRDGDGNSMTPLLDAFMEKARARMRPKPAA